MGLGLLRGLLRGGIAWLTGYLLLVVLVVLGVVEQSSGVLGGAAQAYLGAHVLPGGADLTILVVVPVLVVGVAGYRAGKATRTGLVGRLRTLVRSVHGSDRRFRKEAATAAGVLAGGYAVTAAIVALAVGAALPMTVAGHLLYGLVVGVPAAIVGARRYR